MKQILTTIVLLSLIATTAQAVPVAMQRSGNFTSGPDTPSDWNIMLFFDSDDILDQRLQTTEVTDFMITTNQGTEFFRSATYDASDIRQLLDWTVLFTGGNPTTDESLVVFFDSATNQTFFYDPTFDQVTGESSVTNNVSRDGRTAITRHTHRRRRLVDVQTDQRPSRPRTCHGNAAARRHFGHDASSPCGVSRSIPCCDIRRVTGANPPFAHDHHRRTYRPMRLSSAPCS